MFHRFCAKMIIGLMLLMTIYVVSAVPQANAIQITVNYNNSPGVSTPPAADLNGTNLTRIVNEAASRWSDIIEGSYSMTINVWYVPPSAFSSSSTLADAPIVSANSAGNRTSVGNIRFNNASNWYYDATEDQDEEYNLGQTLFRDLGSPATFYNFTTAPQELEAGFRGAALSTSPTQAQNGTDLLSVALHEIGHHLGVTNQFTAATNEWSTDNDYDLPSNLMRGATVAARTNDGFGHLISGAPSLMQPSIGTGTRILPSATDVFAAAVVSNWTQIDLQRQDFIAAGSNNSWIASNWMGNQVPGTADDAFIRSQDFNPTVELVGTAVARNLFVGQGDNLSTNSFKLDVIDTVTIDGTSTTVYVNPGGEIETEEIILQNGASLWANGLADAQVLTIDEDSTLGGTGTVAVGQSIVNNGTIYATGGTLLISGVGTNWDLDGTTGDGILSAVAGSIAFQIGSPLADDFNGKIVVGQDKWLASAQPFVLASGAEIQLNGGTTAGTEANLNVVLSLESSSATIEVNGRAENHADFNLVNGSVNLAANAILELSGSNVVSGGSFNVETGADLLFQSDTELSGGSFNTTGTGEVKLNGATEYLGGTLNVVGLVHQDGDATVSSATTINGSSGSWDLDGTGGDTKWYVNDDLTLNVARIESGTGSQKFDGRIYLSGSGTTMTVNTSTPWTLDERLTLGNGTVLAGSAQINVTGAVIAQSARIDAPVAFKSGSNVSVAVGKVLQLDGTTNYEGGSYSGGGTLHQDGTANVLATTTIGTNVIIYPPTVGPPTTLLWLEQFDWDGSASASAVTNISPGVTFTINAVEIDDNPASDGYDGTVNINGGALMVNTGARIYNSVGVGYMPVAVAPVPWLLEGTMNLQGSSGNTAVVMAQYGSPMHIHGEVNATGGSAIITGMTPMLAAGGQINVLGGADLSVNNGLIAAGTIDVRPGGQIHINGGNLQSSLQMIVDGTAELSGTTFQGGSYEGAGLLRQLGNANFAQTTLLEISTEFAGGGTNSIATGKELLLASGGQIEAGAVFQGSGVLRNLATSTLALSDGAQVDVLLINEGILAPGNSPGLAVVEEFSQTASGVLIIELYGDGGTPGVDFDQLLVNKTANLDGTLEVLLMDGFVPSVNDTFDFLDWSTRVGTFDEVLLPGNLQWNIDDLYTSGQLIVEAASFIPGDANKDGKVDVTDLGILTTHYGLGGGFGWEHGDFTGNGFVDVSDLGVLASHYGETISVVSVPEPGIITLLFCGLTGSILWRRWK